MHTAARAPFLSFVRTHNELPLRIAEKNLSEGWQKFKTLTAVGPSYDGLLFAYQSFIDTALENHQTAYRKYVQDGGTNTFFTECWLPLLSAAVEEAAGFLSQYSRDLQEKEKLLQDLKRISEGCLLVLDKALA